MTTMHSGLGRWPNAPLAHIVAQVRFEVTPSNDFRFLTELVRQAAGDRFPVMNNVDQLSVVISDNGQPSFGNNPTSVGKDLISNDFRQCLRIQNGSMTLNSSVYDGWDAFLPNWKGLLEILCSTGPFKASRIGLRFVDFILPKPGSQPEDYMVQGIGARPESLPPAPINVSLYEYERESEGRLRIQYTRGFGPPMLPPDLQGAVPTPPILLANYQGGTSAVLDMDRWEILSQTVTAELLADRFTVLRNDMKSTFTSIITPMALAEWRDNDTERT